MEKIRQHLSKVRIPRGGDKIYKDECMFCFDSPEHETGLYVCLNTFLGWSIDHVLHYSQRSGNCVFLHLLRKKKEIPTDQEVKPEKKIARLAIGVEGGFNPDGCKKKYEYEETNSVVILPDFDIIPLPNLELPELVLQSINGVLKADSALHMAEVAAAAGAWDGEVRQVTKHAYTLTQLDNNVKIPPSGWKCEQCDKTDNLWLNLTDGTILCGRRQLDGSGGNNHAVEYYEKTKYPLAVKLGTVTQDGNADVYSYDEDDMVIDPCLAKHLAHFGINVKLLEKTEKTMIELEIDYNKHGWEWSRITEYGNLLECRYGPGCTGLKNLGNSCYLNSVMQVLLSLPTYVERFYTEGPEILNSFQGHNPADDFNVQMAKLSHGLLSGRYSQKPEVKEGQSDDHLQPGLSPLMFRTLVGRGHPEFSTKRQQDAMEFLQHILELTKRYSGAKSDPGNSFRFEVEDRFQCSVTKQVRYSKRVESYLPLPVAMGTAENERDLAAYESYKAAAKASNTPIPQEEQVNAVIIFENCLNELFEPEQIRAFSPGVGQEVSMEKSFRFSTFPDYLLVQVVKYGIGEDWVPIKYNVSIEPDKTLRLSALRSEGIQPFEKLMPETPDTLPSSQSGQSSKKDEEFVPNATGLSCLMDMGFTREQVEYALRQTHNNVERAGDWIFSHEHELDQLLKTETPSQNKRKGPTLTDGDPTYELAAFISHMGTSIHVGHYVCHIKKDNEWIIFNDNKVSKSRYPAFNLGYLYVYKRRGL